MTRTSFWNEKFQRTVERDRANLRNLGELGWDVMVVWECEAAKTEMLRTRLAEFLKDGR